MDGAEKLSFEKLLHGVAIGLEHDELAVATADNNSVAGHCSDGFDAQGANVLSEHERF